MRKRFPQWKPSQITVTNDSARETPLCLEFRNMEKEKLQVESRVGSLPDIRILRLSGSLTISSCYEIQDMLRADTSALLIVDLSELRYVDSSGIGALVNGYMAHHMAGGRMVLAAVNQRIRETLEETRVTQFLTVYESVDAAQKDAGKQVVGGR